MCVSAHQGSERMLTVVTPSPKDHLSILSGKLFGGFLSLWWWWLFSLGFNICHNYIK